MSPMRRTSSSSNASCSSMRLRSRMRGCDNAPFDHRPGSESLISMSASSLRRRAESKILPQAADFVPDGSVGEFEIVQHLGDLSFYSKIDPQRKAHGLCCG